MWTTSSKSDAPTRTGAWALRSSASAHALSPPASASQPCPPRLDEGEAFWPVPRCVVLWSRCPWSLPVLAGRWEARSLSSSSAARSTCTCPAWPLAECERRTGAKKGGEVEVVFGSAFFFVLCASLASQRGRVARPPGQAQGAGAGAFWRSPFLFLQSIRWR